MGTLAVVFDSRKDVRDILKSLYEMGDVAGHCIYLLQTSFIYNSRLHLDECRAKLADVFGTGDTAAKEMERLGAHPDMVPYASIPSHLLGIGEGIRKLSQNIDRKIKEGVLFSEKAVDEITFLTQRLIDILGTTSDILLARNGILGKYIQESEGEVIKKALEYATFHEERLIEGICSPAASVLYIAMLDAIKNIAWDAKQIAVKLTS